MIKKYTYIKNAAINKENAKNNNFDFYVGEKCRFCGNHDRYTKTSECSFCFYETGIHKDFLKRKNQLLQNLKNMAKFKDREFNVNISDIFWAEVCPILGCKLNYFSIGGRRNDTASFDRKDDSKGYVKGNVFIISNKANAMKNNMSVEQIERLIKYVKE